MKEDEMISREDAIRAVSLTCRRLGLLHLAFAMTLVKEFGQEKGEDITAKAIKEYGRMIGEKKKAQALNQGWDLSPESFRKVSDLPAFGMHGGGEEVVLDGEKRTRVYDCVMSQVWREYNQEKLGRIYCYVDPASMMAYNPDIKFVHTKAIPDGDACCELVFRNTTDEDKKNFQKENTDFKSIEKI